MQSKRESTASNERMHWSKNWLFPRQDKSFIDNGMFDVECYFDESGTHDQGLLILAGYIGDIEQWGDFSDNWSDVLIDNEIYVPFHMKDFWNSRSALVKHLSRTQKYAMMEELIRVIRRNTDYAILLSINEYEYNSLSSPACKSLFGTAYTFLVLMSLIHVGNWARANKHYEPISYMWEQGHRNAAQAIGHLQYLMTQLDLVREKSLCYLGSYALGSRDDVCPLQAADILAHNYYRKRMGRENFMRRLLYKTPHVIHHIGKAQISALMKRLAIR